MKCRNIAAAVCKLVGFNVCLSVGCMLSVLLAIHDLQYLQFAAYQGYARTLDSGYQNISIFDSLVHHITTTRLPAAEDSWCK